MKRKITDLEQRLLDKGYTLTCKRYRGNHSQFTKCYEYSKDIVVDYEDEHIATTFYILLDSKRNENVDFFFVSNDFRLFGSWDMKALTTIYNKLIDDLDSILGYDTQNHTNEA